MNSLRPFAFTLVVLFCAHAVFAQSQIVHPSLKYTSGFWRNVTNINQAELPLPEKAEASGLSDFWKPFLLFSSNEKEKLSWNPKDQGSFWILPQGDSTQNNLIEFPKDSVAGNWTFSGSGRLQLLSGNYIWNVLSTIRRLNPNDSKVYIDNHTITARNVVQRISFLWFEDQNATFTLNEYLFFDKDPKIPAAYFYKISNNQDEMGSLYGFWTAAAFKSSYPKQTDFSCRLSSGDQIITTWEPNVQEPQKIVIYDLLGRPIKSIDSSSISDNSLVIDSQNLTAGIYIVSAYWDEQHLSRRIIIP